MSRWILSVAANGKPRAADTHQNARSVAKDFGAFCVKQRWFRANPFAGVEPCRPQGRGRAAIVPGARLFADDCVQ